MSIPTQGLIKLSSGAEDSRDHQGRDDNLRSELLGAPAAARATALILTAVSSDEARWADVTPTLPVQSVWKFVFRSRGSVCCTRARRQEPKVEAQEKSHAKINFVERSGIVAPCSGTSRRSQSRLISTKRG